MRKTTTKKRKLKPIPQLIFNVCKYAVIGVVGFYIMAYLFCFGLYINAEQMDARYEYAETHNGLF